MQTVSSLYNIVSFGPTCICGQCATNTFTYSAFDLPLIIEHIYMIQCIIQIWDGKISMTKQLQGQKFKTVTVLYAELRMNKLTLAMNGSHTHTKDGVGSRSLAAVYFIDYGFCTYCTISTISTKRNNYKDKDKNTRQ